MRLSTILLEAGPGFPEQRLSELSPGLNVVVGPNGSGKTTLARLAQSLSSPTDRGVVRSGTVSGAIEVEADSGVARIVRCARPGHPDTVATIRSGGTIPFSTAEAPQTSSGPDDELVHFAHSGNRHRVDELAAIVGQSARPDEPAEVHLSAPAPDPHAVHNWQIVIGALQRQIEAARLGCAVHLQTQVRRQRSLQARLHWLTERIDRQQTLVCRLDDEWQSAESDLLEHCGSCSGTADHPGEEILAAASSTLISGHQSGMSIGSELCELDRRAAALQEVLEDLATDRLRHTLKLAVQGHVAWCGVHDERDRLDRCELEVLHQLRTVHRRREELQTETPADCPCCGSRRPTPDDQSTGAGGSGTQTGRSPQKLKDRTRALRQQLAQARDGLNDLLQRRSRVEAVARSALWDRSLDVRRYALGELEAVLSDLMARHSAEESYSVPSEPDAQATAAAIMERASACFQRLTQGSYRGLRRDRESGSVLAIDANGATNRVTNLSRGTSEQASLALRLAILQHAQNRGMTRPALWDDALSDTDDLRLEVVAAELGDVALHGQQLILFTCRERVVEVLHACGATVHRLNWSGAGETSAIQSADVSAPESEAQLIESTEPVRGDSRVGEDPEIAAEVAPDTIDSSGSEPVSETAEPLDVVIPSSISPPPLVRVHPAQPHWLTLDSPLTHVPSLGFQFARRLRALHINNVRDLMELDSAAKAGLLEELQITPGQIRTWQSEARLLASVPDLTARDAQLLVSCGISDAAELAQCNIDELAQRVDGLQGGRDAWHQGIAVSPRRDAIARWIGAGRGVLAEAIERQVRTPHSAEDELGLAGEQIVSNDQTPSLPLTPSDEPSGVSSRFRLHPESPILDAPSIGLKTARLLRRAGIQTVADLLECDPVRTAARLRHRRLTADVLRTWQRQSVLMCTVPDLRCADAIVLVACGIASPLDLRRISPSALASMLLPLVSTVEGQRMLRGAAPPTMEDIARWTETVEETRVRRAA